MCYYRAGKLYSMGLVMAKIDTSFTDEQLTALLSGKDAERAFTLLYDRYSSRIHAYCYRIVEDSAHAEDIFQETFIRFFQNAKAGREMRNVPGFLITIARNLCLNHKRDRKVTVAIDDYHFPTSESKNYEQKELLDLIARSLELLDYDHREAFVLREYDGLSYEEVAEIIGTTVTNAKSRAFRAKQKIKAILQPYLKDLCG